MVLLSSIAEDLGWNEKFLTIEGSQMKVFSVWNLINSNLPQDNIIVSINQEITDMDAMINPMMRWHLCQCLPVDNLRIKFKILEETFNPYKEFELWER